MTVGVACALADVEYGGHKQQGWGQETKHGGDGGHGQGWEGWGWSHPKYKVRHLKLLNNCQYNLSHLIYNLASACFSIPMESRTAGQRTRRRPQNGVMGTP